MALRQSKARRGLRVPQADAQQAVVVDVLAAVAVADAPAAVVVAGIVVDHGGSSLD